VLGKKRDGQGHRVHSSLESEMRDKFIDANDAEHHSDYEAFLQEKVNRARVQIAYGRHVSNEAIEAECSERRDALRRKLSCHREE
jgi:hypothetical protein